MLEKAQAVNPNNGELVEACWQPRIYAQDQFDKSEKLMKTYLAANPNATDQYLGLAKLYEFKGKLQDAIAAYQQVLDHPMAGGGVAAFKNSNYASQSWYSLASLYMNLAEREDVNTAAGKADLAQASNYADKYRLAGAVPAECAEGPS